MRFASASSAQELYSRAHKRTNKPSIALLLLGPSALEAWGLSAFEAHLLRFGSDALTHLFLRCLFGRVSLLALMFPQASAPLHTLSRCLSSCALTCAHGLSISRMGVMTLSYLCVCSGAWFVVLWHLARGGTIALLVAGAWLCCCSRCSGALSFDAARGALALGLWCCSRCSAALSFDAARCALASGLWCWFVVLLEVL